MLFDTHLHLIYPDKLGYPWLSEVPALNKPYHYEEYEIIANRLGIDVCFHMEVDVREEDIKNETTMLERLSSPPTSKIKGIISYQYGRKVSKAEIDIVTRVTAATFWCSVKALL